uniref:Multiple PDZ domain crumbs cell polarity complex component n=1 Tax=Ciona savignyi TaxID=51511 RepID=H2YMG8_CIOSA
MPSQEELEKAAVVLKRLQNQLKRQGDYSHDAELDAMKSLMESPLFKKMVQLQASIQQLKKEASVKKDDFDINSVEFSPDNGGLVVGGREIENDSSIYSSQNGSVTGSFFYIFLLYTYLEEFIESAAKGRETEMVEIYKSESEGLGFSVVGLKSEHRGDLGIFVQDIRSGGVADRDGRLKESDQILVINNQPLTQTISHQEAIAILQKVKGPVKLVVARGGIPQAQGHLSAEGSQHPDTKWSDVETIDLRNDGRGLGFGIVGGRATGGVVVKTIVPGGAAHSDGRLKSGDHILRIGEEDLTNMGSEEVAQVLRQCGMNVRLVVARGPYPTHYSHHPTNLNSFILFQGTSTSNSSSLPSDAQIFEVELVKDAKGLGISIAGFSPEDKKPDGTPGIYVKGVSPGSAADIDGRIRPKDKLIAVDGKRLDGPDITSEEALDVLRSTGVVVRLTLARFPNENDQVLKFILFCRQIIDRLFSPNQHRMKGRKKKRISVNGNFIHLTYRFRQYGREELSEEEEERIKQKWRMVMGPHFDIVVRCLDYNFVHDVAQLKKYNYLSGLGISLEGTIDENEMPHHYIRSILPEGPVGQNNKLATGDELLEVNANHLLGLSHVEVVVILKELPLNVRMVCARLKDNLTRNPARDSVVLKAEVIQSILLGVGAEEEPMDSAWVDDITVIDLDKGEQGLGFSILDFQDPLDEEKTAVLVRSLVKGGVAQQDGRLDPGDRLIFVNDVSLQFADLDQAVRVLKAVPQGRVAIGVRKPRPMFHSEQMLSLTTSQPLTTNIWHFILSFILLHSDIKVHPPTEEEEASTPVLPRPPSSQSSSSSASQEIQGYPMDLGHHYSDTPEEIEVKLPEVHQQPYTNHYAPSRDKDAPPVVRQQGKNHISTNLLAGEPNIGDMIRRVNNDSTTGLGAAQARALIRNHSTFSNDVKTNSFLLHKNTQKPNSNFSHNHHLLRRIAYIPKKYIEAFKLGLPVPEDSDVDDSHLPNPKTPTRVDRFAALRSVFELQVKVTGLVTHHRISRFSFFSDGQQSSEHERPVIDASFWGDVKRVDIRREAGQSLGISIVGGRTSDQPISNDNGDPIEGIFVKEIIERSPVDMSSDMKPGDKIIKVDGVDLTQASHEEAVEAILKAGVHVVFHVQTFVGHPKQVRTARLPLQEFNFFHIGVRLYLTAKAVQVLPGVKVRLPNNLDCIQNICITPEKKSLNTKYGHLGGEIHVIDLVKGPAGVGLSLAGNKDRSQQKIFVVGVNPNGAAGIDGRLKVGDQLLEVNHTPLNQQNNHELASNVIQNAKSKLLLVVNSSEQVVRRSLVTSKSEREIRYRPKSMSMLTHSQYSESSHHEKVQWKEVSRSAKTKSWTVSSISLSEIINSNSGSISAQSSTEISADDETLPTVAFIEPFKSIEIEDVSFASSDTSSITSSGHRLSAMSPTMEEGGENSDPLTCPIIPGRETTIEINKGKAGLGVSIVGGSDSLLDAVLVHTVYEQGAAAKDGRLWPGDRILSVNNHSLRHATHDEAIEVLRNTPGRVHLTVHRDENRWGSRSESDVYDIYDVQLVKKSGRGLGLSIVGRKNAAGVFVSDLVSGGAASREGTMKPGDQILGVNGVDIKMAGQEVAAQLLKNAHGKVDLRVGRLKSGAPGDLIKMPKLSLSSNTSEDVPMIKEDSDAQIRFVEIDKSPSQPLGISIAGGVGSPLGDVPIFIAVVQNHGAAAGKLKVGDKIRSINGQSTDTKSHDEVVSMLKGQEDAIVLMQVQDGGESIKQLSEYLVQSSAPAMPRSPQSPAQEKKAVDIELHRGSD